MSAVQDDLVYDLGFHEGQDTDFYLKKGFRVIAVEADPDLAAAGRARFAGAIGDGQLTLLNCAIAPAAGEVTFHRNLQNSAWSSIHLKWGARGNFGHQTITVPGQKLEEIVAAHGVPRYLKIDIEGADLLAVKAIRHFPARPRFISVEGGGENFLQLFARLGYDRFAVVPQSEVPQLEQPAIAREGRAVDHTFPMGASGPFGREVQAAWVNFDEAVAERTAFRAAVEAIKARFPDNPDAVRRAKRESGLRWCDVHAARAVDLA